MKISLIIPVYNYEKRLPETIEKLNAYKNNFEIIFIDDGSTDGTPKILEQLASPFRYSIHAINKGKGAAIKTGVNEATGDYIFFTDADIPYDLSIIDEAVKMLAVHDVVLGSRELPGSKSSCSRNLDRKFGSKIFSRLANLILIEKIRDTQCGFKGFRRLIAQDIFSKMKTNGFAFDVELIYLAQKSQAKIGLVPVHLIEDSESSVRFLRDSIRMAGQLLKIYTTLHTNSIFEFLRYGITGVFNTLLNILIFNLLMYTTGIDTGPYVTLFSCIAFVVVITQAFFINALWVFKKKEALRHINYRKFFLVSGIVALVNIMIIHMLVNVIGAPIGLSAHAWANIALLSTIVISVFGNFLGYKLIVFK